MQPATFQMLPPPLTPTQKVPSSPRPAEGRQAPDKINLCRKKRFRHLVAEICLIFFEFSRQFLNFPAKILTRKVYGRYPLPLPEGCQKIAGLEPHLHL